MDEIVVDINRETLHDIAIDTDRFETADPFRIRVRNHGEPSHVHISFNGELADAVSISEHNHFVKPDNEVLVPIQLIPARVPATGTVEIKLAYGSESGTAEIALKERSVASPDINTTREPDEPVSTPQDGPLVSMLSGRLPAVIGVSVIALAVAFFALAQTGFNPVVLLGVILVFGTIGSGLVYVLQQ